MLYCWEFYVQQKSLQQHVSLLSCRRHTGIFARLTAAAAAASSFVFPIYRSWSSNEHLKFNEARFSQAEAGWTFFYLNNSRPIKAA